MTSTLTTTIPASTATTTSRTRGSRPLLRAGVVGGATGAVANAAIYTVARVFDVSFDIKGEAIPAIAFPQLTLIAAVLGTAMAAVFARKSHRPRRAFVRTTVSLTALSMVPPVLADAATATKLVLGLTHLVAAAIIIPAISARLSD